MLAKLKLYMYASLVVFPFLSPGMELCNNATGPNLPGHYELNSDELQDLAQGRCKLNGDEVKAAFVKIKNMTSECLRLRLSSYRALFVPQAIVKRSDRKSPGISPHSTRHESLLSNYHGRYVDSAIQTIRHSARLGNLRKPAQGEVAYCHAAFPSSPPDTPLRDPAALHVPPPSPSSSFETLAESGSASSSGSESSVFGGRRALGTVKAGYELAADTERLKNAVDRILANPPAGLMSPPITPTHAESFTPEPLEDPSPSPSLDGSIHALSTSVLGRTTIGVPTINSADGTLVEQSENLKLLPATLSKSSSGGESRSDAPPSSSLNFDGQNINRGLRKFLESAVEALFPPHASKGSSELPVVPLMQTTVRRSHAIVTSTSRVSSNYPPRRTTHFPTQTCPGLPSFRTDWQQFKQEICIDVENIPVLLAIISLYLINAFSIPLHEFIFFVLGTCPPIVVGLLVVKERRFALTKATRAWQRQAFKPRSLQNAADSCCFDSHMDWETPLITSTPKISVHGVPGSRVASDMQEDLYWSEMASQSEDKLDSFGRPSSLLGPPKWKDFLRAYRTLNHLSMRSQGRRALPRGSSRSRDLAGAEFLASKVLVLGKQHSSGMRRLRRSGTQPHHDLKTMQRSGIRL